MFFEHCSSTQTSHTNREFGEYTVRIVSSDSSLANALRSNDCLMACRYFALGTQMACEVFWSGLTRSWPILVDEVRTAEPTATTRTCKSTRYFIVRPGSPWQVARSLSLVTYQPRSVKSRALSLSLPLCKPGKVL